ncbi:MAG: helix-turn-helix transcriptional regulator [Firmicutes bacterium]|nr:helix-turn-helix transcriptional regulator [Bacillota bacterium]
MYLGIRIDLLEQLILNKGWKEKEVAAMLGINYSHFYRVLKGKRNPGSKFFCGFLNLCKKENIDFEKYVFIKKNRMNYNYPGKK